MINEEFIDFLMSKKTLNKFKKNERGIKFRKANPTQVAAVILCVLKNEHYYASHKALTHRLIHYILHKYKEVEIPLEGKDANLTVDMVYSILRSFRFCVSHKTEAYVKINGEYYKDDKGQRFNNWCIDEQRLCEYIGYEDSIFEPISIEDEISLLKRRVDNLETKIDNFVTNDDEVFEKMKDVLNQLSSADHITINNWYTYFINAKDCKNLNKDSMGRIDATLRALQKEMEKHIKQ